MNSVALPWLAVQNWWLKRQARSATLTLTHRNLYILPTSSGWWLGVTLLLLLIASINDQLNLGYLLTFWLLGMSVVGVALTHANARGLAWNAPAERLQSHAGTTLRVNLSVHNPRSQQARSISLAWATSPRTWYDLDPGWQSLSHPWTPLHRGLHQLPALHIETRYPMGICRAWSWWHLPTAVWVYPAEEIDPPVWPSTAWPGIGQAAPERIMTAVAATKDQLRPYRSGDTRRDIAWKKSASAHALGPAHWFSRDSNARPDGCVVFDMAMTDLSDKEAALSRLCAWVLQADRLGIRYGLRVPGHELAPSHGKAHRHACLEALALC